MGELQKPNTCFSWLMVYLNMGRTLRKLQKIGTLERQRLSVRLRGEGARASSPSRFANTPRGLLAFPARDQPVW